MKNLFKILILCLFTFSFGQDCIDGEEVELWGECYNIEETTSLNLNHSGLSGEIPPEIGNLTNLEGLYLVGNQLSGEIPSEIGNLTNLISLFLHMNQLTGQIPPEIGNLINLTQLNLYYNELSGEIPYEIGNLINLTHLKLYYNELTGEIPHEIENLINLTHLDLHHSGLSGEIPLEICIFNIEEMEYFSIYGNQLCPPYPECIEDYVGEQDTSECEDLSNSDVYPFEYILNKPYPNPFNPSTMISFSVPTFDKVSINVYDLKGSLVTTLVDDYYHSGNHSINWDGSNYSSGNYVVKMKSSNYESSQIITLVK